MNSDFPGMHSLKEADDLPTHVKNCSQRYASLHEKMDKIFEKLNKMDSIPRRMIRLESLLYTGMATLILSMTGLIIKLTIFIP